MPNNAENTRGTPAHLREAIAGVLICVYFAVFYVQPLLNTVPETKRWMALFMWLFTADSLLYEWVGNDITRFALLDRIPIVAAAAAIIGTGYLLGRVTLQPFRLDNTFTKLETFVVATGIGTSLLSLMTLLLGLAGQLQNRLAVLAITVVIAASAAWRWRNPPLTRVEAEEGEGTPRLTKLATLCCIPFVMLIMFGGMLPPWHFDVREYHSQIPKEWYQQGFIGFVPHNVYGNMPLGAEMHAILGMSLFGDWWMGALVGKTVIAGFAPLTAIALYCFGKRFFSTTAGVIAACAYLTTPWTARVSVVGLIEGPYGFYIVLAVYAACIAATSKSPTESAGEGRAHLSLVALTGFFSGTSVACKYPALLFVAVPLGAALSILPGRRFCWQSAAVFAIAVAVSCGPWLVKNIALTGNPTYPLLYSVFGGETRTPEKDARWTRAHQTPDGGVTMTHALESVKLVTLQSEFLSPLLVPLAVIGLLHYRREERITLAIAALVLFILAMWWLLTHRVDRFLFPLVPLVAILVGAGATTFTSKRWRGFVGGLLIFCFVSSFLFCSSRIVSDNRIFVALSELRLDLPNPRDPPSPLESRYTHINATHRYINTVVQPGYRAMLVGEAQAFNFEVPVVYNTCFDDCVFEAAFKDRTRDEALEVLREQRISHVFISWRELDRYRRPGNYGYSDYVTRELIQRQFVHTGLFQEILVTGDPETSQLFEVVGWADWTE